MLDVLNNFMKNVLHNPPPHYTHKADNAQNSKV